MQLKSVTVTRAVVGMVARCDKWRSAFLMPILTAAGSFCSTFPTSWVPCFIDSVCVFSITFRTTSSDKDQ